MLLQGWGCKNPLEPREYWERILIEPRECKEGIWPVNGDAEDVKGGDGRHVHVHRVVEVTHQGPELPRSWWRTLVQLVNIESPKVFILWFILWHFCFLSPPETFTFLTFFNAHNLNRCPFLSILHVAWKQICGFFRSGTDSIINWYHFVCVSVSPANKRRVVTTGNGAMPHKLVKWCSAKYFHDTSYFSSAIPRFSGRINIHHTRTIITSFRLP